MSPCTTLCTSLLVAHVRHPHTTGGVKPKGLDKQQAEKATTMADDVAPSSPGSGMLTSTAVGSSLEVVIPGLGKAKLRDRAQGKTSEAYTSLLHHGHHARTRIRLQLFYSHSHIDVGRSAAQLGTSTDRPTCPPPSVLPDFLPAIHYTDC